MALKELLFRNKPLSIFLQLKDTSKEWYASNLALASGATYVHTTKLLKEFKKLNLITFEPKGRTKRIKLTEKGVQIVAALNEMMAKLEEKEEKPVQK